MIEIIGKILVKKLPASCSICDYVHDDWKCMLTNEYYTSYIDRNPKCPLICKEKKNRCYSPNCLRNAPINELYCKKHR